MRAPTGLRLPQGERTVGAFLSKRALTCEDERWHTIGVIS